jgi:hypothetical protein
MEAERMTLIVETGEGVPTANSYVDIDFIRAYAASRRVPLSNDNEIIEGFAIDAMDLIEARKFKGVRTYTDQPLDGQYATNAIPSILKRAQAALVVYRSQGVSFFATENVEGAVKREKIGPIETEYFDGASSFAPSVPLADVLLEPLERGQGRFSLFTVRV